MTFQQFLQQGWQDHGADPAAVAGRFDEGASLVASPEDLVALAQLAAHVLGEHLGRWEEGTNRLLGLTGSTYFAAATPGAKGLYRSLAIFRHAAGDPKGAARFLELARSADGVPPESDQIRFLAGIAQALTGQRRTQEAAAAFREALSLASYGPDKADPAARALAVSGNNLAAELEERPSRSAAETVLMQTAAAAARRFWEIAGGWLEVERAEYRLALTHLAASEPKEALAHAQLCHGICLANDAAPFELVFAHQARARAYSALGDGNAAAAARAAALSSAEQVAPEWRDDARKSASA